ncbi:MAG: 16S rRNA (adenine1518-N6/adenine1519-N6)-dimethyltransferase [bacterium]|nr:MAG: 16S rRNA (adenine1518-N6/adenine1519-N6)-dimethyltransferase [bacterium]
MVPSLTRLKNYKIRPNKKLGQNFLVDDRVLDEIIALYDLKKDEVVVEIGAGLGALTTRLAPRVRKVLAIEIDKALVGLLKDEIVKDKNVEVITQDVLLFDFPEVAKLHGGKLKVLGNIPYSLSTPLLFKLLEYKNSLSMAILMFQKEVADRIVANPGTKDYGVLSVFSQISAAVSKELLIPRYSFYPQPKVDSAVVRFVFSESLIMGIKDEQIFKSVVRASFAQRRKTLKNTLKNTLNLGILFSDVLNAVKACGIDPGRRGETLSLEEFKDLANYLADNEKGFKTA